MPEGIHAIRDEIYKLLRVDTRHRSADSVEVDGH